MSKSSQNVVKVFGVGNAGGNAIKRMIAGGLKEIELKEIGFYAVNTDLEALRTCDGADTGANRC